MLTLMTTHGLEAPHYEAEAESFGNSHDFGVAGRLQAYVLSKCLTRGDPSGTQKGLQYQVNFMNGILYYV
jgi:hypothetical protein